MGNIWKWFVLVLFLTGCGGNNEIPNVLPPLNDLGGCMSANALLASYGNPPIKVDAADFDGTNDYMLRSAVLTGVADSKTGIISFWYRDDGGDGSSRSILNAPGVSNLLISHDVTNAFRFYLENSAGTNLLLMKSSTTYTVGATWRHILASWDLGNAKTNLYITDVSDKSITVGPVNDTIDYTQPNWFIGDYYTGDAKINGCLAEFYFAPSQYLDFSIEANRRKFISANGKPIHLGIDGSLPTGTAPAIYQHLDDGETAANFATNRGTGGNFTITGTLDTASTSPSD